MKTTGRRIWYGIAIVLCSLVLLLSIATMAGVWITQNALSNAVTNLVDNVNLVTQNIQGTVQGFDDRLASMQEIVGSISSASTTLSQQVANQGLIATLLPEEQNSRLSDLSASVQESVKNIHETLVTVRTMYQTIDALPFVSLPGLSQSQIDQFNESVTSIQNAVDQVNNGITAFRSGASEQISKVTAAADLLNTGLSEARNRIASVETILTNSQQTLTNLNQTFNRILVLASVVGSLLLIFVAYTQVEVILLSVQRWKALAVTAGSEPTTLQPPTEDGQGTIESGSDTTESVEEKDQPSEQA